MENYDELRRLAEAGDPMSQNRLGMMYASGHSGMQDYSEASKWFNKSAAQGNASAQNNLSYQPNYNSSAYQSPQYNSSEQKTTVRRGY